MPPPTLLAYQTVEEMCDWLHEVRNRNIENDDQEFTIPIAFEIIIKDFSCDTGWHITTDIEKHVFNVHKEQGDFRQNL